MRTIACLPTLLVATALFGAASGCNDSRRKAGGPPVPEPAIHNQLVDYGSAVTPITSSVPYGVATWMRNDLLEYLNPHFSVRLTRSALRPGESNLPYQRLLEEVVLTRPQADSRISPQVVGPPPGWVVVAMVDRITLNVDFSTTPFTFTQANGLVDVTRKVIWCWSQDDAVTPEGAPLMPTYDHELRHAWIYELALARGATPDAAGRESKAIDP